MFRKLLITIIAVFMRDSFLQEYTGSLCMSIAFLLQVVFNPMKSKLLNRLEVAAIGAIFITQMMSILYTEIRQSTPTTVNIDNDMSPLNIGVTIVITFIHGAVTFTFLYFLAYEIRNAKEQISSMCNTSWRRMRDRVRGLCVGCML